MDVAEGKMGREVLPATGKSQRTQGIWIPHPDSHFLEIFF